MSRHFSTPGLLVVIHFYWWVWLSCGEIISEIFDDLRAQETPGDDADLLLSVETSYHVTDSLGLQVGTETDNHLLYSGQVRLLAWLGRL